MTPDEYTIQEHFIEVGDGHTLYVHEWGNKAAKMPIIFLHGGPGASCNDSHKNYFDPAAQRVIFFDQRGCGRSVPYGSLEHNTTKQLVEDIEKIATYLRLASFILTGRSWGSCLALTYALKYPHRVQALVIGGIFTGAQDEIDYMEKGEFRTFYPEAWEKFVSSVPASYQNDPSGYHTEHILGNDANKAKQSAYAYSTLEGAVMRLDDRLRPEDYEKFDPAGTKIEVYYMANKCFIDDSIVLKNAHRLQMPVWIVQGRYDAVCPPEFAYRLHKELPNSRIVWTTGGHSGNDRETWTATKTILLQLTTS